MLLAENTIKRFEGFRSEPYLDSKGVPTIGYGTTYYLDGTKVTMNDFPISENDATELMREIIARKWNSVKGSISVPLNDNQKASLISFVYNVGVTAFKESTLLRKLNLNPLDTSIRTEFARWKYSGGQIIQGLITRREKEAELFFKKKVQVKCCCSCFPCSCC